MLCLSTWRHYSTSCLWANIYLSAYCVASAVVSILELDDVVAGCLCPVGGLQLVHGVGLMHRCQLPRGKSW